MTLTTDEARLLDAIDAAALAELAAELVRCPSPNPPGREDEVAACLARGCDQLGLDVELDAIAPGRPNVYASLGSGGGTGMLVLGHTDTVPAGDGWTHDPFAATVDDGRLIGRGAADMKGGVAAAVAAMGAFARAGIAPPAPVTLAAVVDEEEHGRGVRAFLERRPAARLALVPEPTELQPIVACRGNCYVEIVVRGRAAHAGSAEQGRNAIHGAARAVEAVRRLDRELAAEEHPLLGRGSWSVGMIRGGTSTAMVAAECTVSLDRRLLPGQTGERALAEVRGALTGLELEHEELQATAELLMEIPSFEVPADDPLVGLVRGAAADAGAGEAPPGGWTAACDGGYVMRDAGIPAIVLGPGSVVEQAHKPDESVALSELVQAARIYALAMLRLTP
jgi:acetylornithine deacetylase/succinyl-diaminopimelate desuccinylase family protein